MPPRPGDGGVGRSLAPVNGRWRLAGHGVLVTQTGPLSEQQRLWVAVLAAGDGAVLAGLTAAKLDGLDGFADRQINLLIPKARQVRKDFRAWPYTGPCNWGR